MGTSEVCTESTASLQTAPMTSPTGIVLASPRSPPCASWQLASRCSCAWRWLSAMPIRRSKLALHQLAQITQEGWCKVERRGLMITGFVLFFFFSSDSSECTLLAELLIVGDGDAN